MKVEFLKWLKFIYLFNRLICLYPILHSLSFSNVQKWLHGDICDVFCWVLMPFLSFQASRAGLFSDLSVGDSCPLRHSPPSAELRFPPLISREKTAPSDSAEDFEWATVELLVAGRQSLKKRHQYPLSVRWAYLFCKVCMWAHANTFERYQTISCHPPSTLLDTIWWGAHLKP